MIGASLPPGPGPAATAAATPEHAAATTGAGTSPRAASDAVATNGPPRSAPPEKAPRDDAAQAGPATQRGAPASDREVGVDAPTRDFAELLAANGTVDTNTGAATKKPAPAGPDATEPPAANTLPEQLLALLIGDWAPSARPTQTAPADAAPGGRARTPTPQLPAATTAAALPLAAPATAAADADAGGEGFTALAKLATDALGAASGSTDKVGAQTADATSLPDGPAPTATSPVAAPARTGVPAPTAALAMPTDPDAGFDDGFGARIAWMAEQRIGHAEIRLNPEHVGPIDVRVQLDGTRVSAEFHSAHADVRRAIEASMPQLRDMLGQHGLQLGQADVGQRQAQGRPPSTGGPAEPGGDRQGDDGVVHAPPVARPRSRGLLDEYA